MSLPDPNTEREVFLAKAAGASETLPLTDNTREEIYLRAIAEGGGGGGGAGVYDIVLTMDGSSPGDYNMTQTESDIVSALTAGYSLRLVLDEYIWLPVTSAEIGDGDLLSSAYAIMGTDTNVITFLYYTGEGVWTTHSVTVPYLTVLQSTGNSTHAVMSQKAVTDSLASKVTNITNASVLLMMQDALIAFIGFAASNAGSFVQKGINIDKTIYPTEYNALSGYIMSLKTDFDSYPKVSFSVGQTEFPVIAGYVEQGKTIIKTAFVEFALGTYGVVSITLSDSNVVIIYCGSHAIDQV